MEQSEIEDDRRFAGQDSLLHPFLRAPDQESAKAELDVLLQTEAMPIKIPDNLPARSILEAEGVMVMAETAAIRQDIRPMRIGLLNLMPNKIKTETQFARLLGASPLQVELTLVKMTHHAPRNTPGDHILSFYRDWEEVRAEKFDGFIITGAPVERMTYEEVTYWDELRRVFDWTQTNVHGCFTICWSAQAASSGRCAIRAFMKTVGIMMVKMPWPAVRISLCSGMTWRKYSGQMSKPNSKLAASPRGKTWVTRRRRPGASTIRKKGARFLKLHLVLAFHIAKKLDGGLLPVLSPEPEQRDRNDRQENKGDQKILNHSRKAG